MPNPERETCVPPGDERSSSLRSPASPPTFHLSPLLRTRAIQRPTLTFELLRVLIGCARCCKGDLSRSLPVYPSAPSSLVVVVLCSCPSGLSCGFLSWSNSVAMAKLKHICVQCEEVQQI